MSIYRLKGASGAVANQATSLAERTVIGTAEDCDVRIESTQASGRLAEIVRQGDGLLLRRLDGQGEVLLNGETVTEASLGSGDEIRIDRCRWVLQAPGLKPERVLTEQAVRKKAGWMPWLVAGLLVAAAAAGWAWTQGYLVLP